MKKFFLFVILFLFSFNVAKGATVSPTDITDTGSDNLFSYSCNGDGTYLTFYDPEYNQRTFFNGCFEENVLTYSEGDNYGIYTFFELTDAQVITCGFDDFDCFFSISTNDIAFLNFHSAGIIPLPASAETDIFSTTGELLIDFWIIISIGLGVPLAFYIIRQVLYTIPKP